mgnify:CR=1 FL=1
MRRDNRRPQFVAWPFEAAGAVLPGKAVTTEFAYFTPGKTHNPHDEARTPGGSSSGSAAAVAAGMVPIAFGTQTAGSMIRPASYCGVYGFKPTFNTLSTAGVRGFAPSLDTLGWFARSIGDICTVFTSLTGAAEIAPQQSLVGVRIGTFSLPAGQPLAPDVQKVIADAEALAKEAGAEIVPLAPSEGTNWLAIAAETPLMLAVRFSLSPTLPFTATVPPPIPSLRLWILVVPLAMVIRPGSTSRRPRPIGEPSSRLRSIVIVSPRFTAASSDTG